MLLAICPGRVDMTDGKAVVFLIFVSLVMLGAVYFVKMQADLYSGIAFVILGISALSLFIKIVKKVN